METTQKKGNILLALLLSLLTALAGGAVFGLIYGIGYYIYLLAAAEIALAVAVFIKILKVSNGKTMTLAIIWCVLWTFIFNIVAVVLCESIWVAKELGCSLFDAYKVVLDLWKTDATIQTYMNSRVMQIAGMIILGGVVYGVSAIINNKKSKKTTINTTEPQTPTQNKQLTRTAPVLNSTNISDQIVKQAKDLYVSSFNDCKEALEKFEKDQNQETLDKTKFLIQQRHLADINENVREHLIIIINKFLAKEDLSQIDRKVNLALLKMLNN